MMYFIYNISIRIYHLLLLVSSLFNEKATRWVKGRKNLLQNIEKSVDQKDKIIWFHCASLGEFEQGRPLIELFNRRFSQYKILLTFFSPSGYEIRKNYDRADYVFYLPFDFSGNAKRFIKAVNPQMAIFVKYEFWYNYLRLLKQQHIPVFLVSGIFRKNQLFFKWYGKGYRKLLQSFTYLFVQNKVSYNLLHAIQYTNVEITGDTRFDRVYEIASKPHEIKAIETFKDKNPLIVAGSTWEEDENLLCRFINQSHDKARFIFAPHELNHKKMLALRQSIQQKTVLFSEADQSVLKDARVLIIDTIGVLAHVYQYADIAYVGGGFGKGIHNILEAATHGLPVVFGPNYAKFQEAIDLIKLGSAFSIQDFNEINRVLTDLLHQKTELEKLGEISSNYVKKNTGVSQRIINKIADITGLSDS